MGGPKHLWSGDWEDESAREAERLAARRSQPREAEPEPDPPLRRPRTRRTLKRPNIAWRRALPVALAVLIVAGGALAVITNLGSSPSESTGTTAGASLNTQETATWLGMQLQTVAPGLAVIDTVQQGSRGDQAGLEPGDAITAIDNHAVNGVGDIRGALRGLRTGDRVVIQVSYGSSNFQVEATLAAPPSVHP